jgi:hypothetical protein
MEWISVKDRLPENEENVIAYSTASNIENCRVEIAFFNEIWCGAPTYFLEHITHWQPLPSPPKQ